MIEVGDYVRTNCGKIGKLIRIEFDEIDKFLKWYVFLGKNEFGIERELYTNKPYIVKHSKNIIDLIEPDDYVNGYKADEVRVSCFNSMIFCKEIELLESDIKTIVTKESFERASYKV